MDIPRPQQQQQGQQRRRRRGQAWAGLTFHEVLSRISAQIASRVGEGIFWQALNFRLCVSSEEEEEEANFYYTAEGRGACILVLALQGLIHVISVASVVGLMSFFF